MMYSNSEITVPVTLLLTLFWRPCSSLLDIESAKERPCFEVQNAVPIDPRWVTSFKTWYTPLMSQLELYEVASMILDKDPKDILENELYYDGCITWENTSPETVVAYGFDGKSKEMIMKVVSDRVEYYLEGESEPKFTCVSTMTDNKTFMFTASCINGDQMTWSIGSSVPELPKETVRKIHEHAESLGFKREYFTGLSYKTCKPRKNVDAELN